MDRLIDIALKDLRQILRNRMTFLFLLIMPIAFTLLFGFAFSGTGDADARLPVGMLDQDGSHISQGMQSLLEGSNVLKLDLTPNRSRADLEKLVSQGKLAGAVIIPGGYSDSLLAGAPLKLTFIGTDSNTSNSTIQAEVLSAANRLVSAANIASIVVKTTADPGAFNKAFDSAVHTWQNPPVSVQVSTSSAIKQVDSRTASMAQSSPGMMLQFAIASLLTSATVIVNERKSRSLQRLLTTSTSRLQILFGHYLAIFTLIFLEFALLILFGQLVLKLDYFRLPLATLLVAFCSAACISGLGLLIGVFARSEEQAIVFSLIPMFILAGLGGAWVPLDITGATFRAIGHVSPVAWAMDGFKNITIRSLGMNSVLLPAAALFGYALIFMILAAFRFRRVSE